MDKFFIGPMQSGLQKDVKPFLIADTAFERLKNAYLFRSRVRKRFGERLLYPTSGVLSGYESLSSRLRSSVGTTNAAGDLTVTIPGSAYSTGERIRVGGMLSVTGLNGAGVTGTDIFIVDALGAPMTLKTNGAATTHTLNTTTGDLILKNTRRNATVYFYLAEPVMGLETYETVNINNEPSYAFDTRFAYTFTANGWERLGTGIWTGENKDFFWGETHRGTVSSDDTFFITNYVDADHVKYYTPSLGWNDLTPVINAALDTVETARIVMSFKNRLLLFNTREKNKISTVVTTFQNRCRFSQNGTPLDAANAWLEDTPGRGGWIDLPTQETIVTAQHLRDRLIVSCERSTWELVYTGNQILPFVWQQINTELGCESTFSQVPFDQVVLSVGNVGLHACDGQSVKRIDELIPNEVFEIHNGDNGPERVAGVRDYLNEHVYWTFPSKDRSSLSVFPDQLLVYNYAAHTWATFDDSITAFGYMQDGGGSGSTTTYLPKNRNVLAGNQQGFVFIVDQEKTTNCESLQITSITAGPATLVTCINHNLKEGDFILIQNCQGSTELNDKIFPVYEINSANIFSLGPVSFTAYICGGTLTRVSRIDILTKQYNFYMDKSSNMHISQVDFLVDKTTAGEITVDYSTDSTSLSMATEEVTTSCSLGSPVLETSPYALRPIEAAQERLWHAKYLQGDGNCIQLRLYLTDAQMQDIPTVSADFQWHGSTYYVQPTGRLE